MRGNSSSFLSVKSGLPGSKTPRANSMMIGKQTPMKTTVTPIEGSFIVVDHEKRKLSDMGVYKNIGKTQINNGPDSSTI